MKQRIVVVLAVSIVSACGVRARPAPVSPAAARAVPQANTKDDTSNDYVVGPFVSNPGDDGEAVRTYYIVRN